MPIDKQAILDLVKWMGEHREYVVKGDSTLVVAIPSYALQSAIMVNTGIDPEEIKIAYIDGCKLNRHPIKHEVK